MEKKIKLPYSDLDSVVYALLAAKERGEHVFCEFHGRQLHSDTISMDSAYKEILGCTKAEDEQNMKEWQEKRIKEENAREIREQGYIQKVEVSRTQETKPITLEEVISGLKFIVENQSLSQVELIDGLLELGCNFSREDIKKQFPEKIKLFDGIKRGELSCGASIIVNARNSEFGRRYCNEVLLIVDDDTSIYHFVRIATGDETYTKEKVESLNNSSRSTDKIMTLSDLR